MSSWPASGWRRRLAPRKPTQDWSTTWSSWWKKNAWPTTFYTLFAEQYPDARIFERIAASEQQHTDAVARQLDVRGLDNPGESLGAGDYAFDELDALYATWSAQGLESLEAALQVGVDLETADIADLEAALADPSTAPVERVFSALLAGSENHLAAFSSAVENGTPDMAQGMNRQGKGRGA